MDPSIRSAIMQFEKILEAIVGNENKENSRKLRDNVEQNIILCQRELPRWNLSASDQRAAWQELEDGLREWKMCLAGTESRGRMLNDFKSKVIIPFLEETIGNESRNFIRIFIEKINKEQERISSFL